MSINLKHYFIITKKENQVILGKYFSILFRSTSVPRRPTIIPYQQHNISRKAVSSNALKVLDRLYRGGFEAYLVGGSVRDILLNTTPKDFDIATNAKPEQIKTLFRNALLIGKRFRIAHIRFPTEIIEVMTFRGEMKSTDYSLQRMSNKQGMLVRDNVYGQVHEDVWRRDFSINSLYYSAQDLTLHDYCNALSDLKNKKIRLTGEPKKRYQEDPVRLLRGIRLAAKFEDFCFESETEDALIENTARLSYVPSSRLFEEVLKLFRSGYAVNTYRLLKQYQLLQRIFPALFPDGYEQSYTHWIERALQNTDDRIKTKKTVSPAFLFATILWYALQKEVRKQKIPFVVSTSLDAVIQSLLQQQHQVTNLTRFCSQMIKEIWMMQPLFLNQHPVRVQRLLSHPRFRAAYDFLLLRVQNEELPASISNWWTDLLKLPIKERMQKLNS